MVSIIYHYSFFFLFFFSVILSVFCLFQSCCLFIFGSKILLLGRASAHGVMGHQIDMVDPFSYFSFQPVLHDWCNEGYNMCYPVYGMVHIKEPLVLIGKSRP